MRARGSHIAGCRNRTCHLIKITINQRPKFGQDRSTSLPRIEAYPANFADKKRLSGFSVLPLNYASFRRRRDSNPDHSLKGRTENHSARKSGQRDSNSRYPAPKAGVLAARRYPEKKTRTRIAIGCYHPKITQWQRLGPDSKNVGKVRTRIGQFLGPVCLSTDG